MSQGAASAPAQPQGVVGCPAMTGFNLISGSRAGGRQPNPAGGQSDPGGTAPSAGWPPSFGGYVSPGTTPPSGGGAPAEEEEEEEEEVEA